MSSPFNTEALQTLLESDSLTLDNILESLNLSGDELLSAISDGSIAGDSLIDIAQIFSDAAIADESLDDSAKTKIQTLLGAVSSGADRPFTNFANSLTYFSNQSAATTTAFAFANSIFSNGRINRREIDGIDSDRVTSRFDPADETYQSSIPSNAAAFTTVTETGDRLPNGEGSAKSLKWGSSSDGSTNVTFAFDDAFAVSGLSFMQAKSLVISALSIWAKYAPLNFQEVQDPGAGDLVDILVQSNAIDGQGKTLAFAYFPTYGDITFDTAEQWTNTKFLETATHELGHSLGLEHDDSVSAVMNSVLGNKFEGKTAPFLLEDDINGIRNLYGTGSGAVFTLDQGIVRATDPVIQLGNNLVTNGSFEDTPVQENAFGVYSKIKGWAKITGIGFQVDRRTESFGKAADGTAWVELDAYGQNATIGQNVDTLTGQDYLLSVDFTNGGRDISSTEVDVFWEGEKIDRLTGGGPGSWTNYQYLVKGGDRKVSTLAFRAVGAADGVGGFIDNVSLFAKATSPIEDTYTEDTYVLGSLSGSALTQSENETSFSRGDFVSKLIVGEQTPIFSDAAFLA